MSFRVVEIEIAISIPAKYHVYFMLRQQRIDLRTEVGVISKDPLVKMKARSSE